MKKAILLCVVVLALLVKAQSSDPDPAAWYTPSDYKKPTKMDGYTTITDARGNTQEVSFELEFDDDGNVTSSTLQNALADIKVNVNTAIQLIDDALCDLAKAVYDIDYIKAQIKTLGVNLTKVFQVDGMKFKIGEKTYNLKIAEGALKAAITTSTTVEYKDEDGLFMVPDDKTLESVKSSDGLYYLRLKNKPGNVVAGQGKIPYLTSALELDWFSLKDKLDNLSLGIKKGYSKYGEIKDKGIQIKGWEDTSPNTAYTLGEVLADYSEYGGSLTSEQKHHIITRSPDGTLNYVEIGSLKAGGVSVDGTSITTNLFDGAEDEKSASLFGWTFAPTLGIPYKASSETLDWVSQSDIVDNKSIGFVDGLIPGETLGKFEIKGASLQTANNRYFGTPAKGAVSLGWHDLPNVTTNYIEGDEKTLTTVYNEGGIKKLGWKRWPLAVPSLARTVGSEIEWLPLELPTNVTFTCDNVSIATNKNNELTFKGWDTFGHGVIGKAQNGSLVCKTPSGTNGVEHIENDKVLAFGLEDWNTAKNCEENLAELLSRDDNSAHEILTRFADTNGKSSLHYLPLGKLTSSAGSATTYIGTDNQEATIGIGSTTNYVSFASAEDSNVEVKVTKENENTVKITIGVYYR